VIPTVLHHIWLGPRPVPTDWIEAWRTAHQTWTVKLWREADLAKLTMVNRKHFDEQLAKGCWHGASDIARVEILRAEGGVYVDVDSKPLRSFDGAPFMAAGFFAGYEPTPSLPGRIANGTIGAEKGHPILETYARLVSEMPSLDEPWDTSGGTGLTAAVLAHRQCCKPLILPPRTFYATDAKGRPVPGGEVSYSEHFWASTNYLYPVKAAILVPYRSDGGRRDAAWAFVRKHWSALGYPIFEGESPDGPFNAAAARNAAARKAGDWEVAVFVDADTVMFDHDQVRKAVTLAARSGQFVRPYNRYVMTDEQSADAIMRTGTVPMSGRVAVLRSGVAHGGVNIVSRRLFDAVGGYDERFRGWGWEDTAFEMACRAFGGYHEFAGQVHHLWHEKTPDRSTDNPQYLANIALGHRYERATRKAQVQALLDERDGKPPRPPEVGAVVITDGRRECIAQTIPSLEEMAGPFSERIICDDSGDPAYVTWLQSQFPGWTVLGHRRLGHAGAVRFALAAAAKIEAEWLIWSEDDLVYQRPIDVPAMVRVMDADDDIKQMVLKRQAWFPSEVAAGGMIERFDPALFTEHGTNGSTWVEHRQFYSLQPHLVRRALVEVLQRQWPAVPNSEHHFSRRLFRDRRAKVGLWGAKAGPPWVEHVGQERVGVGY
jgi:hypothetical protein